ncbi:MAG TPA: dienelactone hydrolase family protein [Xanthobacteraceae bacterium]|jgi:dienelactone hydrolase|nr:dienelactone hydrolase family protein [Xanthobacteraceae bacterium]
MAVESIFYSVSGLSCRGALVWDDGVKALRPLLLMAPNWRGVIKPAIETGQMLAQQGYVVFVADMFGEGNGPVGTENPMEFLRPFMSDVPGMRRRIAAALDTLTRESDRRAIGDINRRAAIGFCWGGLNVLDLARIGADVQAVVSMHGTLTTPQPAKRGDIKAAVLAVHGAADPVAPKAERDAFEAEMTAAGACWALLTFGDLCHAFTDPQENTPGVAVYDEPATRHGYALAHAFIADAFAGRRHGCPQQTAA